MTVRLHGPLPLSLFPRGGGELARLARPGGHMRSLLRRRPGAALVVVAVRDEARVVGWAAAELKGCRYLLAVFVHPRHRRRGVGDALMRAAWTFAAARWPKAGPLARPADAAGEALYRGAGFESEVELARRAG